MIEARSWTLLMLLVIAPAYAGSFVVPADISVSLGAEPSMDLVSGQPINFTISATNHGPNAANTLLISSSEFTTEFDLSNAQSDCQGLVLAVADTEFGFFYYYDWYVSDGGSLQIGETRSCHLSLLVSTSAPAVWSFGFELPEFFTDINPTNNSASVTLRRALAEPTPIPAVSPLGLLLLGGLFAFVGTFARRTRA
jgi:hypothetical protein